MTLLFEKHLLGSLPVGAASTKKTTPMEDTEEVEIDEEAVAEVITHFALALTDSEDLSESFEYLCSYYDLSDDDSELLADVLIEASMDATDDDDDDDDAIEKNVRSFLSFLRQPFPKATTTTPNSEGMTPLANEKGVKKFLNSLTVTKHPDPYGNDDAFSAKDVKVFARTANRYGHPYSAQDDYNNQKPSRTLAAATRDVSTGNQAFEADYTLPALPIQESLRQPISQRHLAAVDKAFDRLTMAGDVVDSDHTVNHAKIWRETQQARDNNRAAFGDNRLEEFDAIRAKQQKGLRRTK